MLRSHWACLAIVVALLFFGSCRGAVSHPLVSVDGTRPTIPLVPRTTLLDPTGSLSPAEAAERLTAPDAAIDTKPYSRGYIPDTLWSRIVVDVAPAGAGRWYLSLELPNFDRLEVFTVPENGGAPVPFVALGDKVPEPTDIRTRFHIAPIDLSAGRTILLVRGRTGSTMTVDLKLRKLDQLLAEQQTFVTLQGFYIGIAFVLGMSAFGLFLFLRQWIYLVYVLNLLAYCLAWLITNGTGPGVLWPELAREFHVDQHFLFAFTLFGTAEFARPFLVSDRMPAFVGHSLTVLSAVGLGLTVLGPLLPESSDYWYNALVSNIILPSAGVLMITTGFALFRGEPTARLLMLTWIGLLGAIAVAGARDLGFIANTPWTLTGAQLGSVFEMVVFAYMLVSRLGRLQKEKEQVQREALLAEQTHRAELEQRVADRTADLDAAVQRERAARRLQQQFVAMISHEFRTPLAIIDGAAQNVRAADAKGSGRLDKIRSAVRRLIRMVEACLIDDRVDGGTINLERERFDLRGVVREAVDVIAAAAPDHVVTVDRDGEPAFVSADPRLTEIAINNLLENAVKYAPAGTRVRVVLDTVPDGLVLSVLDEGPGVPEGERDRIFERYHRAANTAGTAGAGLGLHLVRSIMDAHGGTITYRDADPRGACFSLRFPATEAA